MLAKFFKSILLKKLRNIFSKDAGDNYDLEKLILNYSNKIDNEIIKIEKKENIKHRGGYFEIKYLEEYIEICIDNYFETHDNKSIQRISKSNIKHKNLNPNFLEKLNHEKVLIFKILPPT